MAEIHIISKCNIYPKTAPILNNSTQRIDLTPWDLRLLLVNYNQKGLLFPEPKPHQNPNLEDTINRLKTSLARALDFFYPLAGRLATTTNGNTTSFFIDCNNAGAQFIHAAVSCHLTISDILDPVYVPSIVHSFFPLNGVLDHEGVSNPLLAVQVTELSDGIFIGCTMNHMVVDGTSFWHFFNSWSEISRGLDCISRPPVLNRWFPNDVSCPIRIPLSHQQLIDDMSSKLVTPLKERVFHFTREKIATLKAKANGEMKTDRISSLQAILAHLWLAVTRCRHVHANQEISFHLLMDTRRRLSPPLPEEYFGVALNIKSVATTAEELLMRGLGWAAWKMNNAVASQTNEEVMKSYTTWVKNPQQVRAGDVLHNSSLHVGSSQRFNMYGNDFGWGKPLAMRSGMANKGDGKITVAPGVEEGSVDIEVCLYPETLHALGDDKEFMEFTAI
ncbi:hypothetical protein LguiA_012809 [Lonicera macranthoides]